MKSAGAEKNTMEDARQRVIWKFLAMPEDDSLRRLKWCA